LSISSENFSGGSDRLRLGAEEFDNTVDCSLRTLANVHRVATSRHILDTLRVDGMGKNSHSGCTVTCDFVRLKLHLGQNWMKK
jgi:hypothetical protein